MDKLSINRIKILSGFAMVFIIFSACNLGNSDNNQNEVLNPTSTLSENLNSDENDTSEVPTSDQTEPQIEMVTLYKLDGTEEVVPRTYTSFSDLLEAKIETGEWQEGEGLVELLKYIIGDLEIDAYPELEYVQEIKGTGILRLAYEYIDENPNDSKVIDELTRLIAQLKPSDEVLETISQPASAISASGIAKTAMLNKQASADSCENLQQTGFNLNYFSGEPCYYYEEEKVNGRTYRVYYPSYWHGEERADVTIQNSLTALTDSAYKFSQFGDFYDINMIISLSFHPEGNDVLGVQHSISGNDTCPITLFKAVGGISIDNFKQTIAHEAFHCYQDWNAPTSDYNANEWWLEGTAEYFSNLVYEDVNYEHAYLDDFDTQSVNKPIDKMSYENFIFFQYMGNVYGEGGVNSMIDSLSGAGGSISTLNSFSDMAGTFQEFVVSYMSTGIQDSGQAKIIVGNPEVVKSEVIDKEDTIEFNVKPFVSSRYRMEYKQEKRFLQSPKEDGTGKYSMAEDEIRGDKSNWSALPPEIRTKCEDDIPYAMVATTTENGNSYKFSAKIDKMEKAECDPCLLGVWKVDNSSFEAYIQSIFDAQGPIEGFPPGTQLEIKIDGNYYTEFKEERELLSRRHEFAVTIGASGYPGLTTIIDSQGFGQYSTQDGKTMEIIDHIDSVNEIKATMNGLPMEINLTQSSGTYSMFGATESGPGLRNAADIQSITAGYQCNENTLKIDDPTYGELLYDRVEEIVPTPVPTLSP